MTAPLQQLQQPGSVRTTPAVVAHRGASEDAPEHTLAAYVRAIEDGADALECDVRLTRDGHLVCVHDRRVDRTSSGRGTVSAFELAELAELDWGCWRSDLHPTPHPERHAALAPDLLHAVEPDLDRCGILTLERLCEVVASAGRRVELAIETKHPTRYGGLVERRVVELLARFGWTSRVGGEAPPARVMSFSSLALRRMRGLAPEVPTVLLLDRLPARLRAGWLPPGVAIAGPSIELVRAQPEYVDAVQRRGGQVHVWTVDRPEDVVLCADLGVEAIITNRPAEVSRQLLAPALPSQVARREQDRARLALRSSREQSFSHMQ